MRPIAVFRGLAVFVEIANALLEPLGVAFETRLVRRPGVTHGGAVRTKKPTSTDEAVRVALHALFGVQAIIGEGGAAPSVYPRDTGGVLRVQCALTHRTGRGVTGALCELTRGVT